MRWPVVQKCNLHPDTYRILLFRYFKQLKTHTPSLCDVISIMRYLKVLCLLFIIITIGKLILCFLFLHPHPLPPPPKKMIILLSAGAVWLLADTKDYLQVQAKGLFHYQTASL